MSIYNFSRILRPLVLLFLPVSIVLGYFLQNFVAAAVWLLFQGLIFLYTRCPVCSTSIYWEKNNPVITLIAKVHPFCTNCGHKFIGDP